MTDLLDALGPLAGSGVLGAALVAVLKHATVRALRAHNKQLERQADEAAEAHAKSRDEWLDRNRKLEAELERVERERYETAKRCRTENPGCSLRATDITGQISAEVRAAVLAGRTDDDPHT